MDLEMKMLTDYFQFGNEFPNVRNEWKWMKIPFLVGNEQEMKFRNGFIKGNISKKEMTKKWTRNAFLNKKYFQKRNEK